MRWNRAQILTAKMDQRWRCLRVGQRWLHSEPICGLSARSGADVEQAMHSEFKPLILPKSINYSELACRKELPEGVQKLGLYADRRNSSVCRKVAPATQTYDEELSC